MVLTRSARRSLGASKLQDSFLGKENTRHNGVNTVKKLKKLKNSRILKPTQISVPSSATTTSKTKSRVPRRRSLSALETKRRVSTLARSKLKNANTYAELESRRSCSGTQKKLVAKTTSAKKSTRMISRRVTRSYSLMAKEKENHHISKSRAVKGDSPSKASAAAALSSVLPLRSRATPAPQKVAKSVLRTPLSAKKGLRVRFPTKKSELEQKKSPAPINKLQQQQPDSPILEAFPTAAASLALQNTYMVIRNTQNSSNSNEVSKMEDPVVSNGRWLFLQVVICLLEKVF
eukprot:jgi/Bigna1/68704/fgenesh1_pg.6_\